MLSNHDARAGSLFTSLYPLPSHPYFRMARTKTPVTRSGSAVIMDELLKNSPEVVRVKPGELVEGTVVFRGKNKLLMDIGGVATGIVSGRELRDSFNTFKELKTGDGVSALVLEEENDEGMIVLS